MERDGTGLVVLKAPKKTIRQSTDLMTNSFAEEPFSLWRHEVISLALHKSFFLRETAHKKVCGMLE